jgi:hypothetical protein
MATLVISSLAGVPAADQLPNSNDHQNVMTRPTTLTF